MHEIFFKADFGKYFMLGFFLQIELSFEKAMLSIKKIQN